MFPSPIPPQSPTRSSVLPKVAIPRIRRDSEAAIGSSAVSDRQRVDRACTNCRKRKVKCTGEKPTCKHCEVFSLPCVYTQGRNDRLKTTTDHNKEMVNLLKDLQNRVAPVDQQQIQKLLDLGEDEQQSVTASTNGPSLKRRRSASSGVGSGKEEHGEAEVSAEVGSNESLDLLDEDLNRDEQARATGFIGKNSEIQWLRRLRLQIDRGDGDDSRPRMPYGPPGDTDEAVALRIDASRKRHNSQPLDSVEHIAGSTYYLDNESIQIDFIVDPFEMPTPDTAEKLFACFMDTVQGSFPILRKRSFTGQFESYYTSVKAGKPTRIPHKWRAILNLVFAIGARFSHLVRAEWQGDERDHLVYYTRARSTGFTADAVVSHPDLQQIQIASLLALYYLSIGQISRSWVIMGIALRYAYALGLHVRNEDPATSGTAKEIRVRVWWALYSLERLLGVITGRPSAIVDEQCSVPLPQPLDEDQSPQDMDVSQLEEWYRKHTLGQTPSLASHTSEKTTPSTSYSTALRVTDPPGSLTYFKACVQISVVTQKVLNGLYSAGTVIKSWQNVQGSMAKLSEQLGQWGASLPPAFDFTRKISDSAFDRERLMLGFYFFSTKILINRPCLCRIERRIENQTSTSDNFNKKSAQACVQAAMAMTRLLSDTPDPISLYKTGPWWSVVHNIMQAISVFMLEMSYSATHMPERAVEILWNVKKLIRWLRKMSEDDAVANRAYRISIELLPKVAIRVHADISDLLKEDTVAAEHRPNIYGDLFSGYPQGFSYPVSLHPPQDIQQSTQSGYYSGFPSATGMNAFHQTSSQEFDVFQPFQQTSYPNFQHSRDVYGNSFFTTYDEHNPFYTTEGADYNLPDGTAPDHRNLPPGT